jgi:cystathionine beta-lyase
MPDVIPMWIADMDFKAPAEVTEALGRAAGHGIFGYTDPDESYEQAVCGWYGRNFGWTPGPGWNVRVPAVVYAVAAAIRALTAEGDAVLIQQPVYYPFMDMIKANNRTLIINELRLDDGRYDMDYEDFEQKIRQNHVRLFILCSPHNPVGRVWTKAELSRLGEICLKYGVYIVSDEIHSDFVYAPHRHTVFADVSPEVADRTITCTAPTKIFNLAGLQTANIFISNERLRAVFQRECAKTGYHLLNVMGIAATIAAYTHGQGWRDELIRYLEGNAAFLRDALSGANGAVRLIKPEGTYLMWLDCRGLGLDDGKLNAFFMEKARLWLHKGVTFGKSGSGFMRMNIACPRRVLAQAVNRLADAVKAGV